MLPVRIEGATRVLGAPVDWDQDASGPCCGLAIRDEVIDGTPYMTSSWEPMPADIEAIRAGGRIMLRIIGSGHPPVALWVEAAPMKLTGKCRILIEGVLTKLGVGYDHGIIGYLFGRLLTGDEAVMTNLENLGIQVVECETESDEFIAIPRLEE